MRYFIVGLGNPGEEYENTRHNAGRIVVEIIRRKLKFPDWSVDKKITALRSEGDFGQHKITLLLPETLMNRSGKSLIPLIKNSKEASRLMVVHDDLDLPLGHFKISFNKNSGHHHGLDSIIKSIKTKAFVRVRIGVSPAGKRGMAKRPVGKAVVKFILSRFKPTELKQINQIAKEVANATEVWINDGLPIAMNQFN